MKKNGFTLVELLTTLIILSILIVIAVAGVSGYLNKSNRTYYENLVNTTKDAAIDFYADNRGFLPKDAGATKELPIEDLIQNKYLEKLVDTKNKKCVGKVITLKKGPNDYDYKVCIQCPSHNGSIGDGC